MVMDLRSGKYRTIYTVEVTPPPPQMVKMTIRARYCSPFRRRDPHKKLLTVASKRLPVQDVKFFSVAYISSCSRTAQRVVISPKMIIKMKQLIKVELISHYYCIVGCHSLLLFKRFFPLCKVLWGVLFFNSVDVFTDVDTWIIWSPL